MWLKTVILLFLVLNTRSTDGKGLQISTEGSQLDSNPSKTEDIDEEDEVRTSRTPSPEEWKAFLEESDTTPDNESYADINTEGCPQNL